MKGLFERHEHLLELIINQQTGSPQNLSQLLGVSPSTVYRYLSNLKSLGYPTQYNYLLESYIPDINDPNHKWRLKTI